MALTGSDFDDRSKKLATPRRWPHEMVREVGRSWPTGTGLLTLGLMLAA